MTTKIKVGEARAELRKMEAESVQTVVTSPPYWALRNYSTKDQIGLEGTLQEHLEALVEVFSEVRRVLRRDGTLWVNYADAYAGTAPGPNRLNGFKPKDLMQLPARVAMALRADGWWLRSEIIWFKKNPMPEPDRGRPANAHEKMFLLSKQENCYYDAEAVRVPAICHQKGARIEDGAYLRNVWVIAVEPYQGAHFATFPRKLVEPCVKAGTSEYGACAACGAPYLRERAPNSGGATGQSFHNAEDYRLERGHSTKNTHNKAIYRRGKTIGWNPTCECGTSEVRPCLVLDPFGGSGTTALVARNLGRDAVLIEINAEYAEMARERLRLGNELFAEQELG